MSERSRGGIGPWRLMDIVQATMSFRAVTLGAMAALPEHGPPDVIARSADPGELPDSNITEREQQVAVERERARRFLQSHQAGRRA